MQHEYCNVQGHKKIKAIPELCVKRKYSRLAFSIQYNSARFIEIPVKEMSLEILSLKVPSLIASDFFQTFEDFGIRRKFIVFSLPLVIFTAEKYIVWKIYINENVTSYGYTGRYRQLQNT